MKKKQIGISIQIISLLVLVAMITLYIGTDDTRKLVKIDMATEKILSGDEKAIAKFKEANNEDKTIFSKENLTKSLLKVTDEKQNVINYMEYQTKEGIQMITISYQRENSGELKNAQVGLITEDYIKGRNWSIENGKEIYFEDYDDESVEDVVHSWEESSKEAETIISFAEDLLKDKGADTIEILKTFIKGEYKVINYKDAVIAFGDVKTKTGSYTVVVASDEGEIKMATIYDLNDENAIKSNIDFYGADDEESYYSPEE